MYTTNDVGSIAIIGIVLCSAVALIGCSELWSVVGCLVVVALTSLMLAK